MTTFYNENNKFCVAWLKNLMNDGRISSGRIDDRSIIDVQPADVVGFRRCHWFSGIAGWDYALNLAGWPDEREVWTSSMPCQPLSVAGQRKGHVDERHLWPAFHRLVAERRPAVIFGEQVASADGREWLAAVRHDLEADGYAVGCACLPACSVGAPHRRYRLFWVAHRMADAGDEGPQGRLSGRENPQWRDLDRHLGRSGAARRMADADGGQRGRLTDGQGRQSDGQEGRWVQGDGFPAISGPPSPWDDLEWLPCRDGKWRPTQPGLFPLAHGLSGRVGRLRAYGNAIAPQVAAEFILAYLDMSSD